MLDRHIRYSGIWDLADIIMDFREDKNYPIRIIGQTEEILDAVKEFMCYSDIYPSSINIDSEADNTYMLTITEDDELLVERLDNEDGTYTLYHGKYVFIFENCPARVLNSNINTDCELHIIDFDDDDEILDSVDEDCGIELCENEDGIHGFSASRNDDGVYKSYSFYTSEAMSEDLLHKMLDKFGF